MALIYFGDNGQRQELHSCLWQTNLENRQEIADYLIRRLQEKNYSADTWFTAQNLVGENQVDWENTEPLNAITTHYPNRNTQKTILGKILKRALFDLNETYEIRYEFKTLYRSCKLLSTSFSESLSRPFLVVPTCRNPAGRFVKSQQKILRYDYGSCSRKLDKIY